MEIIYLQMPLADWNQIVDDIQNMAGNSEPEILQNVKVQWRGTPEE